MCIRDRCSDPWKRWWRTIPGLLRNSNLGLAASKPAESICSACAGQEGFGVRAAMTPKLGRSDRCARCGYQMSVTAGTIFQDTRTPLTVWFRAMWWVTSQKNGVSALGLQRVLGLGSYQTAWAWLHKLRRAMVRPGRDRLSGKVEVDETY